MGNVLSFFFPQPAPASIEEVVVVKQNGAATEKAFERSVGPVIEDIVVIVDEKTDMIEDLVIEKELETTGKVFIEQTEDGLEVIEDNKLVDIAIPEPQTPEPAQASTHEPPKVLTPELVIAPTPEPVIALTPEPATAPTPELLKAFSPEPVIALTPEPATVPTPELHKALSPEPVIALTPEPATAPTPELVKALSPEPVIAPTPEVTIVEIIGSIQEIDEELLDESADEPVDFPTSEPLPEPVAEAHSPQPIIEQISAPIETIEDDSESSFDIISPEPVRASTPEPTRDPTPEPPKPDTPEPYKATAPEPPKAHISEPAKASTDEPSIVLTPEPAKAPTTEPALSPEPPKVPTQDPSSAFEPEKVDNLELNNASSSLKDLLDLPIHAEPTLEINISSAIKNEIDSSSETVAAVKDVIPEVELVGVIEENTVKTFEEEVSSGVSGLRDILTVSNDLTEE